MKKNDFIKYLTKQEKKEYEEWVNKMWQTSLTRKVKEEPESLYARAHAQGKWEALYEMCILLGIHENETRKKELLEEFADE